MSIAHSSAPPSDDPLSPARAALAQRLLHHLPSAGLGTPASVPGLTLIRVDTPSDGLCSVYEPCVALIVQGAKQVVAGHQSVRYGVHRYLIASLDVPALSAILEARPEQPYLAVALRLDPQLLTQMLLDSAPIAEAPLPAEAGALSTGQVTAELLDAFSRLVGLLDEPLHARALSPLVQREIFYRLLAGEAGARLRRLGTTQGLSQQVARAVARLRGEFDRPLRVEELAREARMSTSSFHQHFKHLTAMSPLQYQKQLRLTEARRLMLSDDLDAATAAYRVGYESASQFSREYSRLFGQPPARDVARLRQHTQATEPA